MEKEEHRQAVECRGYSVKQISAKAGLAVAHAYSSANDEEFGLGFHAIKLLVSAEKDGSTDNIGIVFVRKDPENHMSATKVVYIDINVDAPNYSEKMESDAEKVVGGREVLSDIEIKKNGTTIGRIFLVR